MLQASLCCLLTVSVVALTQLARADDFDDLDWEERSARTKAVTPPKRTDDFDDLDLDWEERSAGAKACPLDGCWSTFEEELLQHDLIENNNDDVQRCNILVRNLQSCIERKLRRSRNVCRRCPIHTVAKSTHLRDQDNEDNYKELCPHLCNNAYGIRSCYETCKDVETAVENVESIPKDEVRVKADLCVACNREMQLICPAANFWSQNDLLIHAEFFKAIILGCPPPTNQCQRTAAFLQNISNSCEWVRKQKVRSYVNCRMRHMWNIVSCADYYAMKSDIMSNTNTKLDMDCAKLQTAQEYCSSA